MSINENWNQRFMREAIALAQNSCDLPKVGAIVAIDREIIGKGYRTKFMPTENPARFGYRPITLHAEQVALMEAQRYIANQKGLTSDDDVRLEGAVLCTTLEPCTFRSSWAYQPKMLSCIDLIIQAGIETVVIGMRESNDNIKGEGIFALKKAGVHVYVDTIGLERQLRGLRICYAAGKVESTIREYGGIRNCVTKKIEKRDAEDALELREEQGINVDPRKTYRRISDSQLCADFRMGRFDDSD